MATPARWRKALLRVVRDPALAAQLGRQARTVARERYGCSRVLARLAAVYERVVDRERGDGRSRVHAAARQMEYGMNEQTQRSTERRRPRASAARAVAPRPLLAGALLLGGRDGLRGEADRGAAAAGRASRCRRAWSTPASIVSSRATFCASSSSISPRWT